MPHRLVVPDVPDLRDSFAVTSLGASGTRWAIATPHTAATDAGAAAFERGGDAIDAALAAATTLAVTYPHMCGVGGDLFALVQEPDGRTTAIASSGRSPAELDADAVRAEHDVMPGWGPIPITVPGAVAGWEALHGRGARLPWADAFATATALAHDGAPLARRVAESLARDDGTLAADAGLRDVFFPDGAPLTQGSLLRQPALGSTLEVIASSGAGALYHGDVGHRYVTGLRALGSAMTVEDLASHEAQLLPPLRGAFGDLHVSVVPPNSQGVVLLQMLALLERLELDPDPLGAGAGAIAQVFRVANADRDRHLADADAMQTHVSTLLDDGHLAGLADEVRHHLDAGAANEVSRGSGAGGIGHREHDGDTIALVAADAEGYAVSLVQSLFDGFGAGVLEPSTGIVGHDRGGCFVLDPDHPNALAPAKRPAHTLLPLLVHDAGGLVAVAGTKGGHGQPQIDAQLLLHAFIGGRSPAEAVEAPRWLVGGMDPMPLDVAPWVRVEADVPMPAVESLQQAGFTVDTVGERDEEVGQAHLLRLGQGGVRAGTDARADGSAAAG